MTKLKVAIIEYLEDQNEWVTSSDIASAVGFPEPSVRVSLTNLCRCGIIIRKDDSNNHPGVLYRRNDIKAGFGVSNNIALFDKYLREART